MPEHGIGQSIASEVRPDGHHAARIRSITMCQPSTRSSVAPSRSPMRPEEPFRDHGDRRREIGMDAYDERTAMSAQELLDRASGLLGEGRHEAAVALVDAVLRSAPTSIPALVLHARCSLRAGAVRRARDTAVEASRMARGSQLAAVREILAECDRALSNNRLEEARTALRAKDPELAARLLRDIPQRQAADDFADSVRGYIAGRRLSGDALDTVLEWLLREELDQADDAVQRLDFVAARTAVDRARELDGRGSHTAYLEALIILRSIHSRPARSTQDLQTAVAELRRAAGLADRAAASTEFRQRALQLRRAVDAVLRRAEAAACRQCADALIARHNRLVETYTGRAISPFEASNARRSWAALGAEVARARRQCPAGSEEGRRLADLAAAIDNVQRQLRGNV
ncbi:hypothetical protein [Dactylosporangium sp. CA-139066]|uniref:hypothetical protein n=1 Tax=Dactylosporangium sp. CA-139066 TaxID=3239930 RepID=UPI003D94B185